MTDATMTNDRLNALLLDYNVAVRADERHPDKYTAADAREAYDAIVSFFSEVTKQRDMLRDELIRRDAHHRVIQLCATHRHLPYTYTIKASAAFIDTIPVCPHCNPEALT